MRTLICLVVLIGSLSLAIAEPALTSQQMRRNLLKLDGSIQATKDKIKTVRDAEFLPDLYFALAEFLVDKSRYMYNLKVVENAKVPLAELDFTSEKRPKFEAIEVYDTIIDKFPKLSVRDKALFFKAHEWRELGKMDEMLTALQELSRSYPQSPFWAESQMIIGDTLFSDKSRMDEAMAVYKRLLSRPPGPFTPLAQYKIGWIWINKNQFRDALKSFEQVLGAREVDGKELPEAYRKTDIRREALLALIWPFSELEGKDVREPIEYFRAKAADPLTYQMALSRLAKRLVIKQRYIEATRVNFELLRLTTELKDRVEVLGQLYVCMKNSRADWPVRGLLAEIEKTLPRVEFSPEFSEGERRKVLHDWEVFARDITTRQTKRARLTRTPPDWSASLRDEKTYLALFPKSRYSTAIATNHAESAFSAGQFTESGLAYEKLAAEAKDSKQQISFLDSAIQAFTSAIRRQSSLSKLELTEARYGLRSVGEKFILLDPKSPAAQDIYFHIGQTYYDERRFDQAIPALKIYLSKYPKGKHGSVAANLLLDTHNQREDFKSLVKDGRALLANRRLTNPALRQQIEQIVRQGEIKVVQVSAGDFSAPGYATELLKLARKYKGSSLGDQALFEAFTALKAKKDFRAFASGEQLLMQHKDSKYAFEVATQMGQMALMMADLRRASLYFEIFHERFPNRSDAKDLLRSAAKMRELMGDFKIAGANYKKVSSPLDVARMEALANDWSSLARVAPQVGGIEAPYYEGLALFRLQGIGPARAALTQASQSPASTADEKSKAAHALFLLASSELENYKAVKMVAGSEAQAVSEKAARLKALEAQLNRVIQFGEGRWIIASLYSRGLAHLEFARFVFAAPTPKGLSAVQARQYKEILKKQATPYLQSAKSSFQQCVANAEIFEILTDYVRGCLSGGKILVNEALEDPPPMRALDTSPKAALRIRQRLIDQPRNLSLLSESRYYRSWPSLTCRQRIMLWPN
jgi:cellulose synthase operon protein C